MRLWDNGGGGEREKETITWTMLYQVKKFYDICTYIDTPHSGKKARVYVHLVSSHLGSYHPPVDEGHAGWIDPDRDVGTGGRHVGGGRAREDSRSIGLSERVGRWVVPCQLHRWAERERESCKTRLEKSDKGTKIL